MTDLNLTHPLAQSDAEGTECRYVGLNDIILRSIEHLALEFGVPLSRLTA